MEYYGTEIIGNTPAETQAQRLGRCYELTGYALALGKAPHDAILVHGTMHGILAPVRINHAWLIVNDGDAIWEPAGASFWPSIAWDAIARPEIIKTYSQSELRRMISKLGNWGPWNTTEDELGTMN